MLRYVIEPGVSQLPAGISVETVGREPEAILEALRRTTIGADEEVQTPFGFRRTVYADYTASGRASSIVEDFIRSKVLPCYGNTHTLTTSTARQTTYLRAEAREVIRHHLNATHEDAVIFAGNGSTGAAHLLVQTLDRAAFNIGSRGAKFSESRRDMHYREDRWGSGECTLCGVRMKSATVYQAHQHSEAHRARLRAAEEGTDSTGAHAAQPRRRRVVVLADGLLHHSSSLPFRELLPQYPLSSPACLDAFSGGSWRAAAPLEGFGGAAASGTGPRGAVEMELSNLPTDRQTGLLDETQFQNRLEALRAWQTCHLAEDSGCEATLKAGPAGELVVICVLAAASNVTGLCADVPKLTGLARKVLPGVIVCWDFAAAAGHRPCNLNPPGDAAASVDAAFFSPHKLWGGPGSVGVLAVKKRLLCNAVPAVPGGGVVFYVSLASHSYIQNSEEREEAGTPNIVGCIRAGLVFHLMDQVPSGAVQAREERMLDRVLAGWSTHRNIEILGPAGYGGDAGPVRTGVLSFMIRYGNARPGLYLHYNFVVALLNDLFGIQARGGCACAGPYAQWLLGIDGELSIEFEQCLLRTAQEVLRPGFVRVGVHWAMSEEDVEVLISAVRWVADHGWRFLAAYTFDRETGEWLHRLDVPERRRVWLSSVKVMEQVAGPIADLETSLGIGATSAPRGADKLVASANASLKEAYSSAQVALSSAKWPALNAEFGHLLWFALPADVASTLRSAQPDKPQVLSGESVFAAGQLSARPEHSVIDARAARGTFSLPEVGLGTEASEAWDPLEAMVPEESEEPELVSRGPSFSSCQLNPSIPKPLRGLVGKAIADFSMINEGDRLLVGLSGGKDSLTVLHILLALRRSAPIKFDVAAATVDPETPEFNPAPLVPYLKALGVEYHMLSKPIIEMAKAHMDPKRPSLCAFCSRMKRGLLYSCMRERGYNVLVLGQHLDDFAESFLMSAIHNGLLRTMKANYWVQQEDVRVCRPLLYVRESQAARFAKDNHLPIIADNCPACFAAPKERHKMKLLLASLEFDYPQLFSTLLRTMRPLYALETADRAQGLLREPGAAAAQRHAEEDHGAELVLSACFGAGAEAGCGAAPGREGGTEAGAEAGPGGPGPLIGAGARGGGELPELTGGPGREGPGCFGPRATAAGAREPGHGGGARGAALAFLAGATVAGALLLLRPPRR